MRRQGTRGLVEGMDLARADYRVLKSSRMRSAIPGLPVTGAGADWEFKNEGDYYKSVAIARHVDQNDPIVGQAVNRLVNLVFKSGMKFDAATGNADADLIIKKGWNAWATNPRKCDARGRSNFAGLAKLVFRATVVDGDQVVLPLGHPYRSLQCMEGHRLRTPTNSRNRKDAIHCGVLKDAQGRPREYWIAKEDHGPLCEIKAVADVTKYPAYDSEGNPLVLHVFNPERVSQSRGVTSFIRIIENATAHADLQFAMLIKEQAAACVTILREREAATAAMPMGGAATFGPEETVVNRDGSTTTVHEMRPGLEIEGRPGEKLSINAPNLPGDGFLKHSVQVLTFIAVNLDIPVQVLLLDPTQSNFSSWRGAMDIAQHSFVAIREWMITQFYTPVYEWWLRGEIAENPEFARLYDELGEDIFWHQWTPPLDPYIEPLKDATADELIVRAHLNSLRNVVGQRGLDLDDVIEDSVNDELKLKMKCAWAARTANLEYPEAQFTWRDFYYLGAQQGSLPAPPQSADSPDPPDDGEEDPKQKEDADA